MAGGSYPGAKISSWAPVLLIRHAEPVTAGDTPGTQRPLTLEGRNHARELGKQLCGRSFPTVVLTSPERRASETAALVFPSVVAATRDELSEVKRPWYAEADEHANALAGYLRGDAVEGWEPQGDVIARISRLTPDFRSSEHPVLVSHGVLLTIWLRHQVRLDDPVSFWSNLRMPDAWEFDFQSKSIKRIS